MQQQTRASTTTMTTYMGGYDDGEENIYKLIPAPQQAPQRPPRFVSQVRPPPCHRHTLFCLEYVMVVIATHYMRVCHPPWRSTPRKCTLGISSLAKRRRRAMPPSACPTAQTIPLLKSFFTQGRRRQSCRNVSRGRACGTLQLVHASDPAGRLGYPYDMQWHTKSFELALPALLMPEVLRWPSPQPRCRPTPRGS